MNSSEETAATRNHGSLKCSQSEDCCEKPKTSSPVKKVVARVKRNRIPDEILENSFLNEAIATLPKNYNFEIHKTVHRILTEKVTMVALQFPEGLLMYACIIADIITQFCNVKVLVLGDVTYGACCIDDYTARKLGAQLLIHYGHSCLVPVNVTAISTMYVFVEIQFDSTHLVKMIKSQFPTTARLALMGTIQFTNVLHAVKAALQEPVVAADSNVATSEFMDIFIPQSKPLSGGETLGCTSPLLSNCDAIIFVADGRFHLESAMIRNPHIPAYRYDPYSKIMTREGYDVERMKAVRQQSIAKARSTGKVFGVIFGTLGRQGSSAIYNRLLQLLKKHGKVAIPFLMAEINPKKLEMISTIDVWVQVACPRLSIDWSGGFDKPILTPYELEVCLGTTDWQQTYPMDYYGNDGGAWSNMYHRLNKPAEDVK